MTEEPSNYVVPTETFEPTATEKAIEELAKYPTKDEAKKHIKEIAEKVGTSRATIYRALDKIAWKELEKEKALPVAEVPAIKIPVEKPEKLPPTEEKAEVPPELAKEVPLEIPPTIPPEEIVPPEIEKCRPIFERSINRLVNILTNRLAKLPELGLTPEESEDTMILIAIGLTKYTPLVMEKYYFETTSMLHVVSIALDKFTVWRLTKKEEKAVEKPPEAPVEEKPPVKPEGIPKEPPKTLPHLSQAEKQRMLSK